MTSGASGHPPQFLCLTPTRNESWIIARFLAATKLWADHVILADQGSTDGTREVLQATAGVDLVINDSPTYDEAHRQRLLINQARKVEGKRILIALDADEALSANCIHSPEWKKIEQALPGTVLRFRWVNILPGFEKVWIAPNLIPCGFVDDGSEHVGVKIHSTRIPFPPNAPTLDLHDIVVLHFQFVAWPRVVSKHRWYQAWEYVSRPAQGALTIFRQYNHMHGSWNADEIHPINRDWLASYDRLGVNYRTLTAEPVTWWDREVVQMLRKYGPDHFSKIAIWDTDWNALAAQLNLDGPKLDDQRSWFNKVAHRILAATQSSRDKWVVRGFERLLRTAGW